MDESVDIQKTRHKKKFLECINFIIPCIQFTTEETRPDDPMPFSDTLIIPKPDRTLFTTVNRKPTHTDQYLLLDSPP